MELIHDFYIIFSGIWDIRRNKYIIIAIDKEFLANDLYKKRESNSNINA